MAISGNFIEQLIAGANPFSVRMAVAGNVDILTVAKNDFDKLLLDHSAEGEKTLANLDRGFQDGTLSAGGILRLLAARNDDRCRQLYAIFNQPAGRAWLERSLKTAENYLFADAPTEAHFAQEIPAPGAQVVSAPKVGSVPPENAVVEPLEQVPMEEAKPEEDGFYPCGGCDRSFKSEAEYNKHVEVEHGS